MDAKCVRQLKETLDKKSDLPVTWECGRDESMIFFEGWAKEKRGWLGKSNPHGEALGQLGTRMIELLDLPNAGEVMDEGQGRIFFDPIDDAIKLTYSSTCVLYDMPEDVVPELLRERENVELEIGELDAADFKFIFLLKESRLKDKEVIDLFKCTPDIGREAKTILWQRLRSALPGLGSAHKLLAGVQGMEWGKCVTLDLSGNWTSKEKLLHYHSYVGCEYIAHKIDDRTVVLAR